MFSVEMVVNFILGYITPWLIEQVKKVPIFSGSRTLTVITGVVGTICAFAVHQVFLFMHWIETPMPVEAIVAIGFAVNKTASELSYRTHIKE